MNISERVEQLILNKDYDELSNLTFKIDLDYLIDNLDKEKKDAYISWIMKANFKLKKYDYNIFFIERLILSGKENYELYVYLFASLMINEDYYRIKSHIEKSILLNSDEVNNILNGELSPMSIIANIDDDYKFTCLMLLLIFDDVFNYNVRINSDNVMIACFDLIDQAYSNINGIYDSGRLEMLELIASIAFKKSIRLDK